MRPTLRSALALSVLLVAPLGAQTTAGGPGGNSAPLPSAPPLRAPLQHSSKVALARLGPERIAVDPGASATVLFRATNLAGAPLRLEGRAEWPAGWRTVVLDTGLVSLPPNADETLMVSLSVPPAARAGSYMLRYGLSAGGVSEAIDSVRIDIAAVRSVEVRPLEAPASVVAGDELIARYVATNHGNVAASVRWRGEVDPSLRAEVRGGAEPLKPGEARVIEVSVDLPEETTLARRHRVELRGEGEGLSELRAWSVVEVVPRRATGSSSVRRYPIELRLRGSDLAGAVQPIEIMGDGYLSDGRTRLSFLARGPKVSAPQPGEQEEYRVALETERVGLRAGHHVYALSPLTEIGRYGLGSELRVTAGPVELQGFATKGARWSDPWVEGGGFVGIQGGGAELRANAMHKSDADLASVYGTLSPLPLLRLVGEYGESDGALGRGRAYLLGASGASRIFRYDVLSIDGDDAFAGSYGGRRERSASGQIVPWKSLQLGGFWNDQEWRLAPLAVKPLTIDHQMTRASVGWGGLLALEYERGEYARKDPSIPLDRESERARARVGARVSHLTFRATGEMGTVLDRRSGVRLDARSVSAAIGLRARSGTGMGATIERSTGPTLYSPDTRERISGGVDAALVLGRGTRFQFFAQTELRTHAWEEGFGSFEASLEQRLLFGHTLTLRARGYGPMTDGLPATRFAILEYTIPIGVPAGFTDAGGEVRGRLMDAETRQPVRGAFIRLGDQRVATDGAGEFVFRGVQPGVHYLDVDRGSLGAGQVILQQLPLEVRVESGASVRVELSVVRGATVSGQLVMEGAMDVSTSGSAPSAMLELANGEWTVRRLVRAGDRFDFGRVPPGHWTLRVLSSEIPPYHELIQDQGPIELAPASEESVRLRIIPVDRPIRLQPLPGAPGEIGPGVKPLPDVGSPSGSQPDGLPHG